LLLSAEFFGKSDTKRSDGAAIIAALLHYC